MASGNEITRSNFNYDRLIRTLMEAELFVVCHADAVCLKDIVLYIVFCNPDATVIHEDATVEHAEDELTVPGEAVRVRAAFWRTRPSPSLNGLSEVDVTAGGCEYHPLHLLGWRAVWDLSDKESGAVLLLEWESWNGMARIHKWERLEVDVADELNVESVLKARGLFCRSCRGLGAGGLVVDVEDNSCRSVVWVVAEARWHICA